MIKKIVFLSFMAGLLISSVANAQIAVTIGEPPPSYVEAPAYVGVAPIYPSYVVEPARYHGHARRYIRHDRGRRHG